MDDPQHDDNGGRALYVKGRCFVCNGETYRCYVCNGMGTTYIEASDKTVARWLNGLSGERRDDMIRYITKGIKNEEK